MLTEHFQVLLKTALARTSLVLESCNLSNIYTNKNMFIGVRVCLVLLYAKKMYGNLLELCCEKLSRACFYITQESISTFYIFVSQGPKKTIYTENFSHNHIQCVFRPQLIDKMSLQFAHARFYIKFIC